MSNERQTVNPFDYLPEDKLQIIRDDYENDTYKYENFNQYLKALHDDDLIPEEVLAIIEFKKVVIMERFSLLLKNYYKI